MSMKPALRFAYRRELDCADAAQARDDLNTAFSHLERAHVLSQRHSLSHAYTHWRMLRVGWRRGDRREILGQPARMLAALTKSLIWVPEGNTGGANVNPFKPMPVPADLRPFLDYTHAQD